MDEQMYREAIQTLEFMKKAYENLDVNAAGMGRLVGPGLDCPVRMKTYEELYQYYAAVMQMTVEALEEVQQYQELGTVRELKALKERSLTGLELAKIAVIIQKFKKYEAVGTVEECREARERQRGKKPEFELNLSDYTSRFVCECGKRVIVKHDSGVMDNHYAPNYCSNCGQRFDWSDTD